jgi:hypothetical protein
VNAITTDFAADHQAWQSLFSPSHPAARQLWCLCPESQVTTPHGPRQATSLRAGDDVLCGPSAPAKILHCAEIVLPHSAAQDRRSGWPLQMEQGAFAEGVPNLPLRLPSNALIVPNHFPPTQVAPLTNGATITRIAPDAMGTTWLALICEAAPGRPLTVNGLAILGSTLNPHHDIQQALQSLASPEQPTAPAFDLPPGTGHAALRSALADRALVLGHDRTSDAGIMLLAGDTLLEPHCTNDWCRFKLTPGHTAPPHQVTLMSRHAIQSEIIGNDEKRRLGVAVSRVEAGGRLIPLTHWALGTGWHEPEPGWRWTCGRADLLIPQSTTEIGFQIANILPAYNLPQSGDIPGLRAPPP